MDVTGVQCNFCCQKSQHFVDFDSFVKATNRWKVYGMEYFFIRNIHSQLKSNQNKSKTLTAN